MKGESLNVESLIKPKVKFIGQNGVFSYVKNRILFRNKLFIFAKKRLCLISFLVFDIFDFNLCALTFASR